MKTKFVLIDYENVRTFSTEDLSVLKSKEFFVKLFLGVSNKELGVDLVAALLPIGSRVELIRLKAAGKNALNMFIAFYIGKLWCDKPESAFYIISKDRDYDSLINNLKTMGADVHRRVSIAGIVKDESTIDLVMDELVATTIAALRRTSSPPSSQKSLRNVVNQVFKKQLSEDQLSALIGALSKRGIIQIVGNKVSYGFPGVEVRAPKSDLFDSLRNAGKKSSQEAEDDE